LSILFSQKTFLTVPQLTGAWATELGAPEYELRHELLEDIVNGRFDASGPRYGGQQSGLRLITPPEGRVGFITGQEVRALIQPGLKPWPLDWIVVMKEAVLDFARRRGLPPPSWWAASVGITPGAAPNVANASTAPVSGTAIPEPVPVISATPRGPRPRKLEQVIQEMREDIQQGRVSVTELQNMREKELADHHNVSRDTARKARKAVLSESLFVERQIATNDK
jgi:hypothetical protein